MGLNRIADGDSIMIAIPAGGCKSGGQRVGTTQAGGVCILVGADIVGIPNDTYAADTEGNVTLHLRGIFNNMKLRGGDTPAAGDKLYHSDADGYLTTGDEGTVFAGHAMSEAYAGTDETLVSIRLKG